MATATTTIEPLEQSTQIMPSDTAPHAPSIDSASAVAEASHIVSTQQTRATAARPAEVSPEIAEWIGEFAVRSCASAGEVVLWLVAMITFLAITTVGIWMNTTSALPH